MLPAFSMRHFKTSLMFTAVLCGSNALAQTPSNVNKQTATSAQTSVAAQTPTQAVRDFYRAMQEKRFRDAILMTNWRGAVEPLSAQEMEELKTDFEPLAAQSAVDTTGEQISGEQATVFVKGANPQTGELTMEEVKLRRENGKWTLVMGDAQTEAAIKREGKNYFFNLRVQNRHADVEALMQDIIKAQIVHSLQNNGVFADFATLVKDKLLAPEVLNTETGYRFRLTLSQDKKKYAVNAEPVQYGRTGKLSYLLENSTGKNGSPQLRSDDNGGQPFAIKNE